MFLNDHNIFKIFDLTHEHIVKGVSLAITQL